MRKLIGSAVILLVSALPASAQQSLSFNVGYFTPKGIDSRPENDVLLVNQDFLAFDIKDFNNVAIGGEWLIAVNDHVEAGVGVGLYTRTVPTVYADLTFSDGREIDQDLKLRIVPFTATVRFLPVGHHRAVTPYLGVGVGLYNWRYSEVGEFVDLRDSSIFRDRFTHTGTDVGPLFLGGLRVPIGAQFSTGGEIRYQRARGDLSDQFLGDTIDLGGFSFQATLQWNF